MDSENPFALPTNTNIFEVREDEQRREAEVPPSRIILLFGMLSTIILFSGEAVSFKVACVGENDGVVACWPRTTFA